MDSYAGCNGKVVKWPPVKLFGWFEKIFLEN